MTYQQADLEIAQLLLDLNVNGFEAPGGTDKNTTHNYTGIYAEILEPYRKQKSGTLLEVGVQLGGSSLLWYNYLPRFQLYLSDIQDIVHDVIWNRMNPDRYDFYQGDAYNQDSVNFFGEECPEGFDVIIDDGPHTVPSQVFAVNYFYGLLKPGGILIIEDIQQPQDLDTLNAAVTDKEATIKIYDNRGTRGRYDDLIWTIKKPS